jgi:thioester reductase-like protein
VNIILHNGWPVDFNLSFSSFEPSLRGVSNLIAFARCCTYSTTFFVVSSTAVVGRWGAMPGTLEKVPEVPLEDWRLATMGYGQSKLVADGCWSKQPGLAG